jgi:hypothetical protein
MSDLRDKARFEEALAEVGRIFAAGLNGELVYIGAGFIKPLERAIPASRDRRSAYRAGPDFE